MSMPTSGWDAQHQGANPAHNPQAARQQPLTRASSALDATDSLQQQRWSASGMSGASASAASLSDAQRRKSTSPSGAGARDRPGGHSPPRTSPLPVPQRPPVAPQLQLVLSPARSSSAPRLDQSDVGGSSRRSAGGSQQGAPRQGAAPGSDPALLATPSSPASAAGPSRWRLDGYRVLVTGSTQGIGLATAREVRGLFAPRFCPGAAPRFCAGAALRASPLQHLPRSGSARGSARSCAAGLRGTHHARVGSLSVRALPPGADG